MSRAFTKEIDDAPVAATKKLGVPVPDPNYVTPAGLAAARAEVESTTDDGRRRELALHLATAQALEPPADRGEIGLGARVTVTGAVYELVGAIEADPKRGRVFWRSPIGQALWRARVGDSVSLPRGSVAVVTIEYPSSD